MMSHNFNSSSLAVSGPLHSEVGELPFQHEEFEKVKRGIVEQCCHNTCSLYQLENYCD